MVGALHSVEGQFPDTGHDAGRCPALSKRPGRMYGSRECNGKTRYRTTLSIETQLAMKPVEIEFLVKNNTRQGLSGVSGGIDAVDKDAAQARGRIQALKDEIVRLQKVIAQTPEMDQTENIRQIEALQRQLQALQAATKRTDLVPASAPAAVRSYNSLHMAIQQ